MPREQKEEAEEEARREGSTSSTANAVPLPHLGKAYKVGSGARWGVLLLHGLREYIILYYKRNNNQQTTKLASKNGHFTQVSR